MSDRFEALSALEHEFGVMNRRMRRVMAERAAMVHPDLGPVAYSMLGALWEGGPQRATALADLFAIDKGAVSRTVQQLEELGLIERTPDLDDRRASTLSLSAEGRRRIEEVARIRQAGWNAQMSDWTEDELDQFVAMLAHYNRTFGS